MEAFVGKWEFESATNQEALMDAVGMTDPKRREMFLKIRPTWSLEPAGDQWTVTQSTPQRSVQYTFHLNTEFEHDTLDGRKMKSTITVDGGNIRELHVDISHPDASTDVTRALSDGKMLCTMKIRGVESVLTFNRMA